MGTKQLAEIAGENNDQGSHLHKIATAHKTEVPPKIPLCNDAVQRQQIFYRERRNLMAVWWKRCLEE